MRRRLRRMKGAESLRIHERLRATAVTTVYVVVAVHDAATVIVTIRDTVDVAIIAADIDIITIVVITDVVIVVAAVIVVVQLLRFDRRQGKLDGVPMRRLRLRWLSS